MGGSPNRPRLESKFLNDRMATCCTKDPGFDETCYRVLEATSPRLNAPKCTKDMGVAVRQAAQVQTAPTKPSPSENPGSGVRLAVQMGVKTFLEDPNWSGLVCLMSTNFEGSV